MTTRPVCICTAGFITKTLKDNTPCCDGCYWEERYDDKAAELVTARSRAFSSLQVQHAINDTQAAVIEQLAQKVALASEVLRAKGLDRIAMDLEASLSAAAPFRNLTEIK